MIHFDDLNTELLYEIFDYLSFVDLYQALFNLNQQLNNAIQTYPVCLNLTRQVDQQAIKSNSFTCRALVVCGVSLQETYSYLNYCNFQATHTITFIDTEFCTMELLLEQLSLQRIQSIRVESPRQQDDLNDQPQSIKSIVSNSIMNQLHSVPLLAHGFCQKAKWLPLTLLSVRYVTLKCVSFAEVLSILRRTPNVCSLDAYIVNWDHISSVPDFSLTQLTHVYLYIRGCYSYEELRQLLSLCKFATDCTIRIWVQMIPINMFDAKKWEKLIDECLPRTQHLTMRFYRYSGMHDDNDEADAIRRLEHWAEHRPHYDIRVR